MTNGVAMPSFKPLSTLSARRILTGTARFVKIARPSAESVGARIEPMSAAAAHPADGNKSTAITVPSAIVRGSPIKRSRPGKWASLSTSRSRTVDASANSSSASVSSTINSTGSLVSERWSWSVTLCPSSTPATTKTIGAVMERRSSLDATSAYRTKTDRRITIPLTTGPPRRQDYQH